MVAQSTAVGTGEVYVKRLGERDAAANGLRKIV